MDDVFVASLMSTDLRTVRPEALVAEAASLMLDSGVGSVLVVDDDGRLAGILTTTDFVRIVAESHPKAETPVSAYMTTDIETAQAQDSIREVATRMTDGGFHHMPVVTASDEPIGMVTTTDLAAYLSSVESPASI